MHTLLYKYCTDCHSVYRLRVCHGLDRMIVEFITTYAISAYPVQARCTRYNM